ncbi:adiponectin receptor protein 2 [Planoprotostelium fungivorum]|uniref:Adiponectin receptor protein 2 n=1 Tax=Planoprotostelium fungivorum TaxID=1890364 RepID=A0A2P6NUS4_9EUKA|nr:adiponectin receptor protein 2 [Planoprotostelium fungivorum]
MCSPTAGARVFSLCASRREDGKLQTEQRKLSNPQPNTYHPHIYLLTQQELMGASTMDMRISTEREAFPDGVDRLRFRVSSTINHKEASTALANFTSSLGLRQEEEEVCKKEEEDLIMQYTFLLDYKEVPGWLQFNEFIRSGYRRPGLRYSDICRSLFQIHNETGNCWTHLLGFLFFFLWGGNAFVIQLSGEHFACRFFFFIYWVSLQWCMASSAGYHLFSCHSEGTMVCVARLDYTGISGLILGSAAPAIFYAFYCHPFWQILYLSCMAILGITSMVGSFCEFFHADSFKMVRTGLFASTAAVGIIPVTHSVFIKRLEEFKQMLLEDTMIEQEDIYFGMLMMGALYTLGFIIYVTKFPECVFPGKFDLWFNSHQFWHIFVFAAALVHSSEPTDIINQIHHCIDMEKPPLLKLLQDFSSSIVSDCFNHLDLGGDLSRTKWTYILVGIQLLSSLLNGAVMRSYRQQKPVHWHPYRPAANDKQGSNLFWKVKPTLDDFHLSFESLPSTKKSVRMTTMIRFILFFLGLSCASALFSGVPALYSYQAPYNITQYSQPLVSSDGQFALKLSSTGNFQLVSSTDPNFSLWTPDTNPYPPKTNAAVLLRNDCRFYLYVPVTWWLSSSNTVGASCNATVTTSGQIIIGGNTSTWSSPVITAVSLGPRSTSGGNLNITGVFASTCSYYWSSAPLNVTRGINCLSGQFNVIFPPGAGDISLTVTTTTPGSGVLSYHLFYDPPTVVANQQLYTILLSGTNAGPNLQITIVQNTTVVYQYNITGQINAWSSNIQLPTNITSGPMNITVLAYYQQTTITLNYQQPLSGPVTLTNAVSAALIQGLLPLVSSSGNFYLTFTPNGQLRLFSPRDPFNDVWRPDLTTPYNSTTSTFSVLSDGSLALYSAANVLAWNSSAPTGTPSSYSLSITNQGQLQVSNGRGWNSSVISSAIGSKPTSGSTVTISGAFPGQTNCRVDYNFVFNTTVACSSGSFSLNIAPGGGDFLISVYAARGISTYHYFYDPPTVTSVSQNYYTLSMAGNNAGLILNIKITQNGNTILSYNVTGFTSAWSSNIQIPSVVSSGALVIVATSFNNVGNSTTFLYNQPYFTGASSLLSVSPGPGSVYYGFSLVSTDGQYSLNVTSSGLVREYRGSDPTFPIWKPNTPDWPYTPNAYLQIQSDGNLVAYKPSPPSAVGLWATGNNNLLGYGSVSLYMLSNGVISQSVGNAAWNTCTILSVSSPRPTVGGSVSISVIPSVYQTGSCSWSFGNASATSISCSMTLFNVTYPAGSIGTVFNYFSGGGICMYRFNYDPPTITTLSVVVGAVSMTGNNAGGWLSVAVNQYTFQFPNLQEPWSLSFNLPANLVGTVTINATTLGGQSCLVYINNYTAPVYSITNTSSIAVVNSGIIFNQSRPLISIDGLNSLTVSPPSGFSINCSSNSQLWTPDISPLSLSSQPNLFVQGDGNLVLYSDSTLTTSLWSTRTNTGLTNLNVTFVLDTQCRLILSGPNVSWSSGSISSVVGPRNLFGGPLTVNANFSLNGNNCSWSFGSQRKSIPCSTTSFNVTLPPAILGNQYPYQTLYLFSGYGVLSLNLTYDPPVITSTSISLNYLLLTGINAYGASFIQVDTLLTPSPTDPLARPIPMTISLFRSSFNGTWSAVVPLASIPASNLVVRVNASNGRAQNAYISYVPAVYIGPVSFTSPYVFNALSSPLVSTDGQYILTFNVGYSMVIYRANEPNFSIWTSSNSSAINPKNYLSLQTDGNMVLSNSGLGMYWSTNTTTCYTNISMSLSLSQVGQLILNGPGYNWTSSIITTVMGLRSTSGGSVLVSGYFGNFASCSYSFGNSTPSTFPCNLGTFPATFPPGNTDTVLYVYTGGAFESGGGTATYHFYYDAPTITSASITGFSLSLSGRNAGGNLQILVQMAGSVILSTNLTGQMDSWSTILTVPNTPPLSNLTIVAVCMNQKTSTTVLWGPPLSGYTSLSTNTSTTTSTLGTTNSLVSSDGQYALSWYQSTQLQMVRASDPSFPVWNTGNWYTPQYNPSVYLGLSLNGSIYIYDNTSTTPLSWTNGYGAANMNSTSLFLLPNGQLNESWSGIPWFTASIISIVGARPTSGSVVTVNLLPSYVNSSCSWYWASTPSPITVSCLTTQLSVTVPAGTGDDIFVYQSGDGSMAYHHYIYDLPSISASIFDVPGTGNGITSLCQLYLNLGNVGNGQLLVAAFGQDGRPIINQIVTGITSSVYSLNATLSSTIPYGNITITVNLVSTNSFTGRTINATSMAIIPYTQFPFYNALSNLYTALGVPPGNTSYCTTFSGITCDGYGRVTAIDLSNRSLTGSIPTSITSLTSLQSINLRNNNLTGYIPPLNALNQLVYLYLDNNQLNVKSWNIFPSSLLTLTLSQNSITGSPFSDLNCYLALQTIDLSYNLMDGNIPDLFNYLINVISLNVGYNYAITSNIPPSLTSCYALKSLSLNNMNLFGPIIDLSSTLISSMNFAFTNINATIPSWMSGRSFDVINLSMIPGSYFILANNISVGNCSLVNTAYLNTPDWTNSCLTNFTIYPSSNASKVFSDAATFSNNITLYISGQFNQLGLNYSGYGNTMNLVSTSSSLSGSITIQLSNLASFSMNGMIFNNVTSYTSMVYIDNIQSLSISSSTFLNISALAIINVSNGLTKMFVNNTQFSHNIATLGAGAININSATTYIFTLNGNTFDTNLGTAGAIQLQGGHPSLFSTKNIYLNNYASNQGGAVAVDGGILSFNSDTLTGNTAANHGGSIYGNASSVVSINQSVLSRGASSQGGCIYTSGVLSVAHSNISFCSSRCNFAHNAAAGRGGMIYTKGMMQLNAAVVRNNTANSGGAIYISNGCSIISSSTFSNNSALTQGGTIFNSGSLSMFDSQFNSMDSSILFSSGSLVQSENSYYLSSQGTIEQVSGAAIIFNERYAQSSNKPVVRVTQGGAIVRNSAFTTSNQTIISAEGWWLRGRIYTQHWAKLQSYIAEQYRCTKLPSNHST